MFGFLEDLYWRAYNYGGEVFIGKHHAFGVDGGVFRWRFEEDDSNDRAMYSDITRRSFVYVDYKFMYPINTNLTLYAQAFSKLHGRRMDWSVKYDYDFDPNKDLNFLNATGRGKFVDYGGGIGMKYYFDLSNFGIDVNLNVFKREGKNTFSHYSLTDGWYTTDVSENQVSAYMRVTFFYHFFRFKGKI